MKENNRKPNPLHLKRLMDMVNDSGYYKLLGIKLIELKRGSAKAEMTASEKHLNPFGILHGGAYASMIDTAAYWAAYCSMDEDAGFTSLDLSVTNLAMARGGKLTAEAAAIKEGRSICLCEAVITDESGRKIAHGISKLMILNGRQSVSDAIRSMGYDELPDKFAD